MDRSGDGRLVWRPFTNPFAFVWASWRALELRQLRLPFLLGLAIGTLQGIGAALTQIDIPWWQSLLACAYPGAVLGVIWRLFVAVADNVRTVHSRRWVPYVIAGVAAALVSMTIDMATTPAFAPLDGVYLFGWEALRHHPLELWWSNLPGLCLVSAFAALAYVHFGEASKRNEGLRAVQLERIRLARHTHESRLLATQARVDPEFLFDSLERVRDLYEHDPVTAERMLDDLIVYRLGEERFLVVANAGNAPIVSDALTERLEGFRAVLDDRSLATGLLAVQGPRSLDVLAPLTDVDLSSLRYYAVAEGHVAGIPALVARTGYTGEDGFEVFVDTGATVELWEALYAAVRAADGSPIGLGARDTLRLEAGMPLYGNELDLETTPFDAGLGRVVKLSKPGDFTGRAALERIAREGPAKRLVGLTVEGRGIARQGHPVWTGDRRLGVVTSGTQSPTLGVPIAMAYVAPNAAEPGTVVEVEIRDARVPARITGLPFYKRDA
jgi:aminomethyltransferase